VNDEEVLNFLKKNIISMLGILTLLVFENATYLSSLRLYEFALESVFVLKYSTNYYPHGNGHSESINKNLICIINNATLSEQRK